MAGFGSARSAGQEAKTSGIELRRHRTYGLGCRPSRIAQMLVHGFAGGAFGRIVFALEDSHVPAFPIDDVVVVESVSFGGAIRDTEQLGGTVVTLDGLTLG